MPDRWALPDRDGALRWCSKRNEQGMGCILDALGRYNADEENARHSRDVYLDLAGEIARRRLKASVTVKPSTLGGTVGR
jgi:hypothetical protein